MAGRGSIACNGRWCRRLFLLVVFVQVALVAQAQGLGTFQPSIALADCPPNEPAGLGRVHHPVSTRNAAAQRCFDRGLALIYAFNSDEAIRAFQTALAADPQLAMADWGIAAALGSTINTPADMARERSAAEAIRRAQTLASFATDRERAYIAALKTRYSTDPQLRPRELAVRYSSAMQALSRRWPDDLDAATLYAESLLNLHPWHQWAKDGQPESQTKELITVLQSVLARDPDHIGANHFYIHAVEASAYPEMALESARRLSSLAPFAGHLLHMPAHIYYRVGDYAAGVQSSEAAVHADRLYIAKRGAAGDYALMYYPHHMAMLLASCMMDGRFRQSQQVAETLQAYATAHIHDEPELEQFTASSLFALLRFHRWREVLSSPNCATAGQNTCTTTWHMARGLASAETGALAAAARELDELRAALPQQQSSDSGSLEYLRSIGVPLLKGRIAERRGDLASAISDYEQAVRFVDELPYIEPPVWYYPVRESLGMAFLHAGRFPEAERVFSEDLQRHPNNARSLLGLYMALSAQGKQQRAALASAALKQAWKNADVPLTTPSFDD